MSHAPDDELMAHIRRALILVLRDALEAAPAFTIEDLLHPDNAGAMEDFANAILRARLFADDVEPTDIDDPDRELEHLNGLLAEHRSMTIDEAVAALGTRIDAARQPRMLAMLPLLTGEELDALHGAIEARIYDAEKLRRYGHDDEEGKATLARLTIVLQSLDTAVLEARSTVE